MIQIYSELHQSFLRQKQLFLDAGLGETKSLCKFRGSKPAGAGSTGGRLSAVGLKNWGRCSGNTGAITPTGRNGAPANQRKKLKMSGCMSRRICEWDQITMQYSHCILMETSYESHGPADTSDPIWHSPGGTIRGTPGGPENGMPGGGSPYGKLLGGGFIFNQLEWINTPGLSIVQFGYLQNQALVRPWHV